MGEKGESEEGGRKARMKEGEGPKERREVWDINQDRVKGKEKIRQPWSWPKIAERSSGGNIDSLCQKLDVCVPLILQ